MNDCDLECTIISSYNAGDVPCIPDKTVATLLSLWTSHLSTAKENIQALLVAAMRATATLTLGKTSSGAQLVTNGFEYNGLTVNVDRYHTEFPLIGTNVGDINTISMKIYDSAGPSMALNV